MSSEQERERENDRERERPGKEPVFQPKAQISDDERTDKLREPLGRVLARLRLAAFPLQQQSPSDGEEPLSRRALRSAASSRRGTASPPRPAHTLVLTPNPAVTRMIIDGPLMNNGSRLDVCATRVNVSALLRPCNVKLMTLNTGQMRPVAPR